MATEYTSGSTVATVGATSTTTTTGVNSTTAGTAISVDGYTKYKYTVTRTAGAGSGVFMIEGSLDGTNFWDLLDSSETTSGTTPKEGWIIDRPVLYIRYKFSDADSSTFTVVITGFHG